MKIFHAMACTALLCSVSVSYAGESNAVPNDPEVMPDAPVKRDNTMRRTEVLWRFCYRIDEESQHNPLPLKALKGYVEWDSAIFIGKAVERRLTLNEVYNSPFNGCWVKFSVEEVLKGPIEENIWVKAHYPDSPEKDIYNYENCYFSTGKRYLVTGQYIPKSKTEGKKSISNDQRIELVTAYKDTSVNPEYQCSPIEPLPDANTLVGNIRKILNKESGL